MQGRWGLRVLEGMQGVAEEHVVSRWRDALVETVGLLGRSNTRVNFGLVEGDETRYTCPWTSQRSLVESKT